jgi:hypothetical protein
MAQKFTKAKQLEVVEHIRAGMRPGAAGEALGFARDVVFDLLENDEDFAELVRKAEQEATEHVEESLFQAAVSGNVTAARIWLERRDKPKQSTALVPMEDAKGSDDELAELNRLAAGD